MSNIDQLTSIKAAATTNVRGEREYHKCSTSWKSPGYHTISTILRNRLLYHQLLYWEIVIQRPRNIVHKIIYGVVTYVITNHWDIYCMVDEPTNITKYQWSKLRNQSLLIISQLRKTSVIATDIWYSQVTAGSWRLVLLPRDTTKNQSQSNKKNHFISGYLKTGQILKTI